MARAIIRRQNPIISRLIEIGRCYKGSPKGTSKRGYAGGDDYASHYFRFEPEDRLKLHPATSDRHNSLYDELKEAWEDLLSQGHIKIRFPHPTIEENFPYSNRLTKAIGDTTKTFRECDGQTCTKWTEDAPHPTKKGQTIPKFKRGAIPCSAVEGKECPMGCQASGMLKFMIPDLYPGGVILFPLHSPVDISAIAGYLEPYRNYDLSAMPFVLFRREDRISYEDRGETKQKMNWGLHLAIDPTITRLMLESKQRNFVATLEGRTAPAALPAPKPLAIAPASSGLPTLSQNVEDGFNFTIRVQAAIRSGSIAELNQAIEQAEDLVHAGLYDFRPSMAFIDREAQRGREAIGRLAGSMPAPAIEIDQALVDRLKAVRVFTKHTNEAITKVCADSGVSAQKASQDFSAFLALFRALLIDWGNQFSPIDCSEKFDRLMQTFGEDPNESEIEADRRFMIEWQNTIEASVNA